MIEDEIGIEHPGGVRLIDPFEIAFVNLSL